MSSRTKRIELKPVAGFVVKTTSLTPGVYTPHRLPTDAKETKRPSNRNILDVPEPVLRSIPVPAGFKIFVNIAYDDGVPPPPMSSENNIRKAMAGDDDAYYVPVVVSDGRETSDKSGKASLVFDAIFNTSISERVSKDLDYRAFITEIALERVEEKSGLTLGREIGEPNMKSKGPLPPRTVLVPSYWSTETVAPNIATGSKPLVEEVSPPNSGSSSTLKPPPVSILRSSKNFSGPNSLAGASKSLPLWNVSIENTAPGVRSAMITIEVPQLTKEHHPECTLDLEPNRFIFKCPSLYADLDGPLLTSSTSPIATVKLGLDVDKAKAQWIVSEKKLVVTAPISVS